jgi:3-dehydroquinate dehydratase-2
MKIMIINGPNLNLLGKREREIYGERSFDEFLAELKKKFSGVHIDYFQSNIEGELINKLHEKGFSFDGIILNAGGYTHTSVVLADAVAAIKTPVIEVHISNIFAREDYRHVSYVGSKCAGSISGFGLKSYELAVNYFVLLLENDHKESK